MQSDLSPEAKTVLESMVERFDADHLFIGQRIPRKLRGEPGFAPELAPFPRPNPWRPGTSVVVNAEATRDCPDRWLGISSDGLGGDIC